MEDTSATRPLGVNLDLSAPEQRATRHTPGFDRAGFDRVRAALTSKTSRQPVPLSSSKRLTRIALTSKTSRPPAPLHHRKRPSPPPKPKHGHATDTEPPTSKQKHQPGHSAL